MLNEVENELNNHQFRKNSGLIKTLSNKEYFKEELIGVDEGNYHTTKKLINDILTQEKLIELIDIDLVKKGF